MKLLITKSGFLTQWRLYKLSLFLWSTQTTFSLASGKPTWGVPFREKGVSCGLQAPDPGRLLKVCTVQCPHSWVVFVWITVSQWWQQNLKSIFPIPLVSGPLAGILGCSDEVGSFKYVCFPKDEWQMYSYKEEKRVMTRNVPFQQRQWMFPPRSYWTSSQQHLSPARCSLAAPQAPWAHCFFPVDTVGCTKTWDIMVGTVWAVTLTWNQKQAKHPTIALTGNFMFSQLKYFKKCKTVSLCSLIFKESTVILDKNMQLMLTCNRAIIILFKWINKYFLNGSLLVYIMVNINSHNPPKQKLSGVSNNFCKIILFVGRSPKIKKNPTELNNSLNWIMSINKINK